MIETHARLQRPFIGYCAFWIHQLRLADALPPGLANRLVRAAIRRRAAGLSPAAGGSVDVRAGNRPWRWHRLRARCWLAAAAAGLRRRGGRIGPRNGAVLVRAPGRAAPVEHAALGAAVPGARPECLQDCAVTGLSIQ
ncbi:MAG: hypothetical protein IPK63_10125 [Candidatus Competibacteraceae bacterium]|nr:hypothetical protein [Candidatus Competibacteraceae bacterium]